MNRDQAADALVRVTAFWSALFAEAEAEVRAVREECAQLRAALAQAKAASTAEAFGLAQKLQDARVEAEDLKGRLRELTREVAGSRDPATVEFEKLRGEMQIEACAREDATRHVVVGDVLDTLLARGLLRVRVSGSCPRCGAPIGAGGACSKRDDPERPCQGGRGG